MAWQATMSMANAFFESSPFEDHRNGLENQAKTTSSLFGRLDNITKALGNLGRVIPRR